MRHGLCLVVMLALSLTPRAIDAQVVTGALIATVRDPQGLGLVGAQVRVSSPSLIGGPQERTTDKKGQARFPSLQPGAYEIDVRLANFTPSRLDAVELRADKTIDVPIVMMLAGSSVTV